MLTPTVIVVCGIALFLFMTLTFIFRLYIHVKPNQLGIFYGRKYKMEDKDGNRVERGFKSLKGGGKFRVPLVEKYTTFDITARQLDVKVDTVPNRDGVLINLAGVATIKPDVDEETQVDLFVERFLDMKEEEIESMLLETLKGAMRELSGTMSIEGMIKDREKLNQAVLETASDLLTKIGWKIDSFPIQDIADEGGYIEALGKKKTAEVKAEADIGSALALADARKRTTSAEREAEIVAQDNERKSAEAIKNTNVKKAEYGVETEKARAKQEIAFKIENATQEQDLVQNEQKVLEQQSKSEIDVNKQRALAAKELQNAEIVVPADAEALRKKVEAEGVKNAAVLEAEGKKEALIREGDGEAKKIEMIGKAQATAIEAKLLAEAKGIEEKSKAYEKLNEAGKLLMIVNVLSERGPDIVKSLAPVMNAVAAPLGNIEKLVVYDSPGGSGDVQSSLDRLMASVPRALFSFKQQAEAAGIDFDQLLAKLGITQEDSQKKAGSDKSDKKTK